MARLYFILILLLAACTAADSAKPRAIQYDGYGKAASVLAIVKDGLTEAGMAGDVDVGDIDPALETFLSPAGRSLILLPNRLDTSQLDFSIESLKLVDRWLQDIHTINALQTEEGRAGEVLVGDGRGDNSVMFAGLYAGEVIRRNSRLDWTWQRFDRFVAANPYFTEHYGHDAGLDSFVLVGPQGAATPINSALKRVLLGKEESLHFLASLLVEPVDLETALSGHNFYGLTED